MRAIYADRSYLDLHPTWHSEDSPWKAQHVVRGLEACGCRPTSLCDIGCGAARVMDELRRRIPSLERLVGFEPSPDAPIATDLDPAIEVRREDAAKSDDRFDCAISLDVFEHVDDYFGFLRAIRKLAPIHVFHIPLDANAVTILWSGFAGPRQQLGHLHYFTDYSALETLRDTGYEPIHWHFTAVNWEVPGKRPYRPLNLMRRIGFSISQRMTHRLLGGLSLLVVARVR